MRLLLRQHGDKGLRQWRLKLGSSPATVSDSFLSSCFLKRECSLDDLHVMYLEMLGFIRRWKFDRRRIHQTVRTRRRGFIHPVAERAEVSGADWWSHVSLDRPSSTTLHTITRRRHQAPVSYSSFNVTGNLFIFQSREFIIPLWGGGCFRFATQP